MDARNLLPFMSRPTMLKGRGVPPSDQLQRLAVLTPQDMWVDAQQHALQAAVGALPRLPEAIVLLKVPSSTLLIYIERTSLICSLYASQLPPALSGVGQGTGPGG